MVVVVAVAVVVVAALVSSSLQRGAPKRDVQGSIPLRGNPFLAPSYGTGAVLLDDPAGLP